MDRLRSLQEPADGILGRFAESGAMYLKRGNLIPCIPLPQCPFSEGLRQRPAESNCPALTLRQSDLKSQSVETGFLRQAELWSHRDALPRLLRIECNEIPARWCKAWI